jgi:tetratricopeptide (TPR) repeat protein
MPRYRSKKHLSPFASNPDFESFLQKQILESKKGLLYSNAIFLSELLQQTRPSKQNLVILGELHYQRGNYDKVVGLLRKCDSDQGRYLLGMSLYKLKRLDEAEKALVMKYCVISEYPKKDEDHEMEGDWLEEVVQGKVVEGKEKKVENESEIEGIRGLKENSEPTEEGIRIVETRPPGERHRKKTKKSVSIFR